MRDFTEFKDINGDDIEEGDVLEFIEHDGTYNLLRVHWDWRREEPGVLSYFEKKHPRSRWLAEVEKEAQIFCKHYSNALLMKIPLPKKYFSSGGVPFVPLITQMQAIALGKFYDNFPPEMSYNKRKSTAEKILRQLGILDIGERM